MEYRIGTFNMYKFQAYRSDDDISKNLNKIAEIICTERFDIIAMQEIFSKAAMDRVLARLGGRWKGCWDSPESTSAQAAEGYAFIWDTRRIELAQSITAAGKKVYYPRIYRQYKADQSSGRTKLLRNPYYGRFHPVNTFFEIRLINTHIMYSAGGKAKENSLTYGDTEIRRREFETLVKSIYAKEEDKRYGNNMPAYTVILGDYNLNLKRLWTESPYLEEVITIRESGGHKRIRTVQDGLSTLKRTEEDKGGFANNYDHFSYDETRFQDIDARAERIDTVGKYMRGDFRLHKKEVSDHIPVVMYMNF